MAVVGAGPAGFYTAHRVLSKIQDARVDMFERWPTPFGLTRYGVAPDHAEVRVSFADEDALAEAKTSVEMSGKV